ncbi:hypothetical protein [Sphingobium ummariense]|uniref:Uncharacterized protein n=1 Tax=Sphingobium ummariense RL-3 TaxID=1346791 RepID=T0IYE1_9SPHN|nr:hypothetical protein [Sphingobium ummariense]EQB30761.1 hypothetical protein M529_18630 [Sphingobium ummariense RL-3]
MLQSVAHHAVLVSPYTRQRDVWFRQQLIRWGLAIAHGQTYWSEEYKRAHVTMAVLSARIADLGMSAVDAVEAANLKGRVDA